ncbi:DNRLRE domain-containing protein [Plantactinospora sp. KLBMP9567]|uniref:golvesin C-terminal-like domain-containing protein n=1 Tax=Plantactinospora sp. KLBMP9567 TaxID=3085900 RepID=UPI002980B2B8|nr:DNRLRE domain-containing protein [Plantactinospora sp. KLBMP9567]MDW5330745.1 DNRLRE domain-containing protein [Plantactinospora sp. KLBMP9567]
MGKLRGVLATVLVLALVVTLGGVESVPSGQSARTGAAGTGGDDGWLSRLGDAARSLVGAGPRRERPEPVSPGLAVDQAAPAGREVKPAKRVRELTGRRSATTRFFEMSDGRTQAEVSTGARFYRDPTGRFQPIDTTLRPGGDGGFANTSNTFGSRFGVRSDDLVRFDLGGERIRLGLAGPARRVTPTVDGDTVTYRDLADGVDVTYQVTGETLKESIILRRASATASVTFQLDPGRLAVSQRDDQALEFRDPDSVQVLLVMPAPFMFDARDDAESPYGKTWSDKVTQRLDTSGPVPTLTVSADREWLADPARVFPVTVDPTIKIQPTPSESADAMIVSDDPAGNYDGNWRLSVGTTTSSQVRSLVRFDLTGVPRNTTIDSASLEMYFDQEHTTNAYDVPMEARQVTAPWTESTVTWNSVNASTGVGAATVVTVDDTDTTKTAISGDWPASANPDFIKYGINGTYKYNKNSVSGETFTWIPTLPEAGAYTVDAHYVTASDRSTAAPYRVVHSGGTTPKSVNQQVPGVADWATLGTFGFTAGTTGRVVLGDAGVSSSVAVIADAVRFTKAGAVKEAEESSVWHRFPVTNVVQSWLTGTANHGFMLKAADEATLGRGGPRYEAAEYAYNGENENSPKLIVNYGRPGVTLAAPTTIHSTGAELAWSDYPGSDLAEYQVHRSVFQTFTPSAATLVAPVPDGTTTFTDTTATPTPVDSEDPFGQVYYYMVAVKTRDGTLIPAPTQIVRLPRAGRTVQVLQGDAPDTTLASAQPSTGHDVLAGNPWLMVGNNSGTYGTARSVVRFPGVSSIPANAQVLEAEFDLWSVTTPTPANATYEVHALNQTFDEASASWDNAATGVPWTKGGNYDPAVPDTVTGNTDDPAWRIWYVKDLVQRWVSGGAANHGFLVKLANEISPAERTLFLSSEAAEPQLRPKLVVTYTTPTTAQTYHAPDTPRELAPASTYTVPVTVSNPTTTTWSAAQWELSYRWARADGIPLDDPTHRAVTPLGKDIGAGDAVSVSAQVKTPPPSTEGNKRTDYVLKWELHKKNTDEWLSDTVPIAALDQIVSVAEPTSNQLGLEKFYSYAGKNTGAGGTLMNNLYAGNTVWSYDAFSNPSRGLATFVRLAYNSLDTTDTVAGYGWSLQASSLMRLGTPLDFHPNPNPTKVTLTDGDGTSHWFTWDPTAGQWVSPNGVHLYLQRLVTCGNKTEESRAWQLTRPDRTKFFYDCDGYMSAVVDNNLNELLLTYEERKSNNKPTKFLRYLTDPTGRRTLTIDYYAKGADYSYIDDTTWTKRSASNLTNPHIIDHVSQITDISGRKLTFTYTDKGLLGELVDGAGSTNGAPKVFKFAYDMTQGNKNVKLVSVTDPRGHATELAYYSPPQDDPKFHWWTKTYTDRLDHPTQFAYTDPDGPQEDTIQTVVTDAENHTTTYLMDAFGRPVQTTNAKNQVIKLDWDDDHNVERLEENNRAVSTWRYDQKTGYPLEIKDAEAVKNGWPGTTMAYQTGLDGYTADLVAKQSPEGRRWTFTYTAEGDLETVTDPMGPTTTDPDDYTTRYTYDTWGQQLTATDANGNTTRYGDSAAADSGFHPSGYPKTITEPQPFNNATGYEYDERGNVLTVTDALDHHTTQTYDTYGRPLVNRVPVDEEHGRFITTPAPKYDANDNVTEATAPNGAVSTAVYDDADQIVSATAPKNSDSGSAPERMTTYTYDKTGHVLTITEPNGNATDDPTDYTTTNTYNEIYQLTDVVNALGDKISYRFDDVGNLVTVIDPKKNATADPDDYSVKNAYDLRHRIVSITDALGKTSSIRYDKDSLTLATRDAEGNETLNVYDERGKLVEVKVPYSGTGDDIVHRTTRYEYDEVGNTVRVISPRGTQTENRDDFATRTEYDALNRPVKQFQPYDPADGRYNNAEVYTQTFYDEVGRVSRTSLPPSEGQKTRNDTTYTYFDNGWARSSTDPWDIVTSYDYDELGLQTSRTLTSADGETSRTMGWSYYPNGARKTKSDDGVPVGSAVPLVDNSDVQHVTTTGTWDTAEAAGQQGIDHRVHAAGAGTDTFTWTLNIPKDGKYTAYVKFPAVAGAATTAKFSLTHSGGVTDKTVDQTSGAGTWVSLGSFDFAQGNGAKLTLTQNAAGVVVADGVKLVRDTSGETDEEKHDFRYVYDLNGNLTSIDDNSSGAKIDAYTLAYTELNQVKSVTEAVEGEANRMTSYTYDEVNNPLTVSHPKQFSKYTYDLREKVASVSVGDSADDPSPQVSSYTYTDRGQLATETKGNGNVVTNTYYADQSVRSSTEKKADGSVVASHTYEYDANGNKAKDVAAKMNADDHSATLSSTTEYSYDPADRIAQSVKTGNGATTETYVHDDNANVISQNVGGLSTTFRYDRNRLQTSTTDGAVSGFTFDPFGRQESVTRGGQVVSRSVYDGFDRVTESQQRDADGSMKSTKYTFDPLDRTLSTTAGGKTTDYTYLGLSDEVLLEEVNGQLSKSYRYSPWGQRLSQVKVNDDGTTEDGYYGYNSHTDVETLTDEDGDTRATYGYTAYGNEDKSEFTGIDKPDPADLTKEQYNSFRFNGKRWDPNSETYDMGFRDYSPGLNRFTTRDMYNGALADMGLGSDPFTGNRYAFTGGNPISNVEVDGHFAIAAVLPALAVVVVAVVAYVVIREAVKNVAEEIQSRDWTRDEDEPEPEPKPTPRPPGPGTDTDTDEKGDCTRNGQGWVEHGETDAGNGNRATGVEACLTGESIKGGTPTTQTIRPPGYNWAGRTAAFLGSRDVRGDVNNCHLLGKQLGGSGTDLKNLATCSAQANWKGTSQGTSMRMYEDQVRRAVETGKQTVHYAVTPLYDGNRTVPVGFHITAYGTNPDGTLGIAIDDIVPNTYNGTNLGAFNDPNTGAAVPTGGTS